MIINDFVKISEVSKTWVSASQDEVCKNGVFFG